MVITMSQTTACFLAAVAIIIPVVMAQNAPTKNVLFLVADDMRPQLGTYLGPDFPAPVYPEMITPNLDKLASRSVQFDRAYCQQAYCTPSRSSFLTARRPDTTHVYDIGTYFRDMGNFTTLPQYLKERGYTTMGIGKIFHTLDGGNDDPISWTTPYYHSPSYDYWTDGVEESWRAVTAADRVAMPLPEDQLANETIHRLRELDETGEPFFVAVGMYKPHLPFVFPEEYLAYYPADDIHLPSNPFVPTNLPHIAWYGWKELRTYSDIEALNVTGEFNSTLPDNETLALRRAYYATISYVDDMFGLILDELEQLGIANNTIVTFLADHGWQLGEHAEWCKYTTSELSTRVPLMVHIPGTTEPGWIAHELVELVDIFPTVLEAAGLPQLSLCSKNTTSVTAECREGTSLMALVNNNTSGWKDRIFSQNPRENATIMGYSMRNDGYRYTEWVDFTGEPDYEPIWSSVHGVELYDHNIDPYENNNVADDPAYEDVVVELSAQLHGGWWAMI